MKKVFFVTFIFFTQVGFSQSMGEGEVVGSFSKSNPIPATPNVAAFEKYGSMPVNTNSGVPQIGVPIHQIQLNGFSWPISLSYHAGGFKSTDVATRNGLGWTMQANGVISLPSSAGLLGVVPALGELDLTFSYNSAPSTSPYCDPNTSWDVYYAKQVLEGNYSSTPEVYNVNIANGISIKLLSGGVTIPASDYIVSYNQVKDLEGNKYDFYAEGYNTRTSACLGTLTPNNSTSNSLTKITTAKGQTIYFTYDTEEYEYELPPLHIIKALNSGQTFNCNAQYDNADYYCTNSFEAIEKRLKKIESSTGEVVYFYYSSRDDLPGSTKMDSVKIWQRIGADSILVKSAFFEYSYFGSGSDPDDLQLKLNQVDLTGSNTSNKNTYKFWYDSSQALPSKTEQVRIFSGQTFDRFNMSTAGVIKQIQYPTGGYTKFSFDTLARYGILKVTKIWDSTSTGGASNIRTFEYGGLFIFTGQPEFVEYESVFYFGSPTPVDCRYNSPCEAPYDWLQTCNATTWKSEPAVYPGDEYADQSPRFTVITEKFGVNGENGKTEYIYGLPSITRDVYDVNYLAAEYLAQKSNYKKNSDNSYTLVSRSQNNYEVPSSSNTYWGGVQHPRENRLYSRKISLLRPEMRLPCCWCFGDDPTNCERYITFPPIYQEIGRRISSVPVYLTSTKEIQYSESDSLLVQKNYYYDDSMYLQPSRIHSTNSKGETIKTITHFPYNSTGTAVYDSMIVRNYISPSIETIDSNVTKATELSRVKTNYQLWQSNKLTEPVTLQQSINGNTLQTEMTAGGYNVFGGMRQFTGKDGLIKSYIWDYKQLYPVAEINNADTSATAATSFEEDSKGGWTYSGSVSNSAAITGSYCYGTSGGNITKTGLASNTYIVSYWGNGSVNVNSAGPTNTGKTIGVWTYYEHEVTGTSITVSGSNYIDELRLYPKGAQMRTITYSPVFGITSECDINNRIIYYEYDDFNRLKLIKDEDGRVLKRYEYKYQTGYLD